MASKTKRRGSESGGPELGILGRRMSRRDFLKKTAAGLAGLGALGYGLDRTLLKSLSSLPKSASQTFPGGAPDKLWKWSKQASYFSRTGKLVQCGLCPNQCLLDEGSMGTCRARVNKGGVMYTLTYGNPCAVYADPIEKKPLFHFLPGTKAYSIATAGCNLRCKFCQNWDISQKTPDKLRNYDMPPAETVASALKAKSLDPLISSIAYTYSEPVAFYDYMLDTAKIARNAGIRSAVITAAYINEKPLMELSANVDAIKVDLKGFNEGFYRDVCSAELGGVLNSIKTISRQKSVWLEIVNLVVPTLNDDLGEIQAMCDWVKANAGADVPLHFSRFQPQYKLTNLPPTPQSTLIEAREIALDAGLNYVYIGNVYTEEGGNTYCPNDGTLCIARNGFNVTENRLDSGRCPECGRRIAGVWN